MLQIKPTLEDEFIERLSAGKDDPINKDLIDQYYANMAMEKLGAI